MEFELLKSLTAEDIKLIKRDINLLKNGYRIIYAIDNHDIVDYCFPFGIDGTYKKKSIDIIGDEHLAYDFLFSIFGNKLFLPNEYLVEVLNERNRIIENTSKIHNIKESLEETFLLPILNTENESEREKKLSELEEHLSFLLSFALMAPDSVSKFLDILKNKINYDIEDFFQGVNKEELIFETSEYQDKIENTFDEWLQSQRSLNHSRLKGLNKRPGKEVINYLDSVYRDISVLVSLNYYNKQLEMQGKKTIILFHSSTPIRSNSLFELENIKNIFPIIQNTPFKILRNKAQTYLLSLIWKEKSDKAIAELELKLTKFIKIAEDYESSEEIKQQVINEYNLSNKLFEFVNQGYRSTFENSLVLKQIKEFKHYQLSIAKQISLYNKSRNYDFKEITGIYQSLIKVAKGNTIYLKNELAEENLALNYSFQADIFNLLLSISNQKKISITKGNDAIRGAFHHLPILLFYDQPYISNQSKEILNPLIEYCIFSKKKREGFKNYFFDYIKSYNKYYLNKKFEEPSLNIISILLLLLIPRPQKSTQDSDINKKAVRQVEILLQLYKGYQTLNINQAGLIDYYKEVLYLKTWVYRRFKMYPQAESAANVGIEKYKTDPRFYHGKALVLYSKYYKNPIKGNACFLNVEAVKSIIELAQKAKKIYKKKTRSNEFVGLTIAALNNMLAHLYTELYKLNTTKRNLLLITSRKYIIEVKDIIKKRRLNYDEYPEILQTEANLEIEETLQLEKKKDYKKAMEKIYFAEDSMNKAILQAEQNDLYFNTKSTIIEVKKRISKSFKKLYL